MKVIISTLCLFAFLFAFSTQTFAIDFTVNQAGDAGDGMCDATCTLRDAVDEANAAPSDDTIGFTAGITNIILTNQIVIELAGTLTITGTGANVLTIDGGTGTNRIFVTNFATATITDVTLTGGEGGINGMGFGASGGAIYAFRGTLVLNRVHITGNSTTEGAPGGGIVYDGGANHQILNSTISDNTAFGAGGFTNQNGTLTIINSTISGNKSLGGVAAGGFDTSNNGNTTLRNVTVTDNSTESICGGFYQGGGTLDIGNSIVAGNTGGDMPDVCIFNAAVTTAGYNLIGNNNGAAVEFPAGNPNASKDIVGTSASPVDAMLEVLAINGGTNLIPTHELKSGSPAIDKGFSFGSTTDQRGLLRPANNLSIPDATGGDGSDIGAFEVQFAPTAASVLAGGRVITADGRGIQSVRVTITDSNGATQTVLSDVFGNYSFDGIQAGETYIFSVSHKRYSFNQNTQVHSITEETNQVNFIGLPIKIRRRF